MGVLHRICREQHRPISASRCSELSAVLDRLLEKRPTKRFATAAEFANALTRLTDSAWDGQACPLDCDRGGDATEAFHGRQLVC